MRSRRRTIHDAKGAQTVNHSALVGLVVAAACVACGGPETVPTATEQPPAVVADAQADVSVGTVSFSVDGQAKKFDHLPAGHNVHTPLSSSIVARPFGRCGRAADGRLHRHQPKERDPGNVMSAMANVGFSYTSADGIEGGAGPDPHRVVRLRRCDCGQLHRRVDPAHREAAAEHRAGRRCLPRAHQRSVVIPARYVGFPADAALVPIERLEQMRR